MTGNTRIAIAVSLVAGAMVGLAFAAVPLYRVVCKATGFAGTPRVGGVEGVKVLDREITVRFDANVSPDLPWTFKPVQKSQTLKVGEKGLAFFEATNLSDKPITGTASFNIVPLQAAYYFVKLACFCFTKQTLQPGQTQPMPVTYYVDPALVEDPDVGDTTAVTLSYTFHPVTKDPEAKAASGS